MESLLVIPKDVRIMPVAALSAEVRAKSAANEGDYAISRPSARMATKILDGRAVSLLKQFADPRTIVDAVRRFSLEHQLAADTVLDDAFPMLLDLFQARVLVAPGDNAEEIGPTLSSGDLVLEYEVVRCIQSLGDTELYQGRDTQGKLVAIKLARVPDPCTNEQLTHEASVLAQLNACRVPELVAVGWQKLDRRVVVTTWLDGSDAMRASQQASAAGGPQSALPICASILDAYAELHRHGVVHGDVHPRNVLVVDGHASLIDFGMARLLHADVSGARRSRAGVGFFFEPEYATAVLARQRPPAATPAGEQYAVAALLYFLLTGTHTIDFGFGREEMLGQIAALEPVAFTMRGVHGLTGVEEVLRRALRKDPSTRYPSLREFAAAFRAAIPRAATASVRVGPSSLEGVRREIRARLINGPTIHPAADRFPRASVTYGAAGAAHGVHRIAAATDDARLFSHAELWLSRAWQLAGDPLAFSSPSLGLSEQVIGTISPYHNASGIVGVQGLLAAAQGDAQTLAASQQHYTQLTTAPCQTPDVTLGQCGAVLGALWLMDAAHALGQHPAPEMVAAARGKLDALWEELAHAGPLAGGQATQYLGIAHGWAGYLFTALRWAQSTGEPVSPRVCERLGELAQQAVPEGNAVHWPVQAGGHSPAPMTGWCNGSAGHVFLWTLAHRLTGETQFLRLAELSARDAARVEDAGSSLCCGLAGQAYAQLAMFQHTGEPHWLRRAQELAEAAAGPGMGPYGAPELSLYKGTLGLAVLAADLDRPHHAVFPLFGAVPFPRGVYAA